LNAAFCRKDYKNIGVLTNLDPVPVWIRIRINNILGKLLDLQKKPLAHLEKY
jgi:hypothetical protein